MYMKMFLVKYIHVNLRVYLSIYPFSECSIINSIYINIKFYSCSFVLFFAAVLLNCLHLLLIIVKWVLNVDFNTIHVINIVVVIIISSIIHTIINVIHVTLLMNIRTYLCACEYQNYPVK